MSEKIRKSNYMQQSGIRGTVAWTILFLFLVKMVYMSYQIGMRGMSFYAYAEAVFISGYILLGVAVFPVLKKMVYFQFHHGNYKNTEKVYRVIAGMLVILSLLSGVLLFIFATKLSVLLFGTRLCALVFRLAAVALLGWILMFCLKGYMEGIGNAMPGIFAELSAHLVGVVVTVLSQPAFSEYGRKVAALMRQDAYAYAYSACSGVLGLAIGGWIGFLFLSLIRSLWGKEIRSRVRSDETRKTDSVQDILWNFFENYFRSAFLEHIGVILAVVLLILYSHMSAGSAEGAGMLFVAMVIPVLIPALLAWQMSLLFTRQLTAIMKQADFHHAKEKMSFYLKLLSYTVLPYFCVGFALAPLLAETFFDVESMDLAVIIRIGMISGMLVVYGILFRQILPVVIKPYLRNLCAALLGVSGIGFVFILKWSGMKGEECAAYAYLLACLLFLLLSGFFVLKRIRIYNRLVESIVLPLVSSLFSAAVVFGLFILLDTKLSAGILLLLCAATVYVIYHLLIAFLQVFASHEWSSVPASKIPVFFAKLIGKY